MKDTEYCIPNTLMNLMEILLKTRGVNKYF